MKILFSLSKCGSMIILIDFTEFLKELAKYTHSRFWEQLFSILKQIHNDKICFSIHRPKDT